MKKNISINISGIIFHIEEDGYDTLRKYLDSINSYFGTFEDSSEILADIESRIAEIFLSRLNDGKQIITAEDVQSLTATMGSVNDFRAAEEQEASTGEPSKQDTQEDFKSSHHTAPAGKRLLRDHKRKILGGVCAGLANYFGIDPVWPRLLFALLMLGTYGIFIVVYIILWIALPFATDLEDEPAVKKMYRDPDGKVIGGVAGGVAAFFGADVVMIRVLFGIFSFFFGTGIVVYIILWIVLPEAKSITDKMKMQGEPVTLSNIEHSVKKNLNEKDGEESTLARIILFPFRMIAAILNAGVRILLPLLKVMVDIVRVCIGLVFSLTGIMMLIALVFAFSMLLGLFSLNSFEVADVHVNAANLPLDAIRKAFPTWTLVFAFIAAMIPALFITSIGSSIIAKRFVVNAITGWALFIVFIVSIVFLAFRIPQLVYSFKEEGENKVEKNFNIYTKTPVLKLRETGLDDYNVTELSIKGYEGTSLKLVEKFQAQGISRLNALDNAMLVNYNVEQTDSVILFDSNISFKPNAKFSFQRLDMDLYIPYDKPFVMDASMWRLIRNHWSYDSDSWRYGDSRHEESHTFKVEKDGTLTCLSCPPPPKDLSGLRPEDQYGLKNFNEISMSGLCDLVIREGSEFAITMDGGEKQKKLYNLTVDDETLEISYRTPNKTFWKEAFSQDDLVKITITMPSLKKLDITGAGKIKINGFHEDESKITVKGAMVVDARISASQLYLDLSGPILFELDGEGDFMEASISKAAQLKASSYHVNHGIIEAKELGQAKVNVSGTLEIDKDFTSNVRYVGEPEVIKKD